MAASGFDYGEYGDRASLESAARGGDAQAQFLLGDLLCCGDNEADGIQWLRRAAAKGDPMARKALDDLGAGMDSNLAARGGARASLSPGGILFQWLRRLFQPGD
jgi:TPR repeat protein